MNKFYRFLLSSLLLSLCLLILLELLLLEPHPHFHYEEFPGFYGVIGFVSFVTLVFGAKFLLRPLVSRPEGYIEQQLENQLGEADE